jgi:ATP-dependent DNA ligase
LLFRRRQCVFIAFDLLYLNGKDLRRLPLIHRKAALKKLLKGTRSRILYLDHVEGAGRLLFEQIIAMDLEGIVCKRKDSPYKVTEKPSRYWIKVKNSRYSQLEGRQLGAPQCARRTRMISVAKSAIAATRTYRIS